MIREIVTIALVLTPPFAAAADGPFWERLTLAVLAALSALITAIAMLRAQREKIQAEKDARAAQEALERARLDATRDDNTGSHLLEAWKIERAAALSEREELAREREVSKREREAARLAREALHHAETAARLVGQRLYVLEQTNIELRAAHADCPGKIAQLQRDVELLNYTRGSERPPA